ncbi:MAG: phosphoenolpyruvate carboxylase [Candidatus Marsarchaeota archaeon]|nr:phosphoenolpyruvate carboxylase [Candidatus Marsarchaeota archaeon]
MLSDLKAPATMSTQHPDNVQIPFFSEEQVLGAESEIKEAFYAFSHLGCQEQMWDFEGKETDSHVVAKLLNRYGEYFKTLPLGRDYRLTFRLPNPAVEPSQGKVLLEALESIPRHYDVAHSMGIEVPPIFEIILPMTTNANEVRRISAYYKKFVVGKAKETVLADDSTTIAGWLGDFSPSSINVIPLVEDRDSLLNAGKIAGELIASEKPSSLRVFLARSDPALNYGSAAAVLYNKIALQKLHEASEHTSVPIYPIIGVGSAPFRGNLRPTNTSNCLREYPSVQTFTIQSSFKYDYPQEKVREAVSQINAHALKAPLPVDEAHALALTAIIEKEYCAQLVQLQPFISALAKHVPSRRARRLHVGLFGYSRSVEGLSMPRAIPFCCALYSMGIPPELLGLSALSSQQWDELHELYVKIDEDLADALKFANPANFSIAGPNLQARLQSSFERAGGQPDGAHAALAAQIKADLISSHTSTLGEKILQAAKIRGFLG